MAAPTRMQELGLGLAPAMPRSWVRVAGRWLGPDWATAWVFVLPTVLLLFGLIGFPLLRAIFLSFHNAVGPRIGAFVGLDNYIALWSDDFFTRSVRVTVTLTVVAVAIKLVLGLLTALLLHHIPRWGAVLGGLILLPYIIPDIVRALAWRVLLDPLFGGANYILVNVLHLFPKGLPWFGDANTALPSVILVNVWAGMPFFIILLVAGLKSIDAEMYDAASVDGASAWRKFLHITLPGLRYVIIVAVLLSTIFTANNFTLTYLLTQGGPGGATRTYPVLTFEAVKALRYGAGSAIALTMAPFLFILVMILGRYMMRADEQLGHDEADGPVTRALAWLLWPFRMALAGCLWLIWRVNDLVEAAVEVVVGAVRPLGRGVPVSRRGRDRTTWGLMYLVLGVMLLFELLPFYFVIMTAFKSTLQIQQIKSLFWPDPWTLDQFVALFTTTLFGTWYLNTIMVTAVSTVVSLFVASLGAYGLVRLKWTGAGVLGTSVLISYLMPSVLMVIPMYTILVGLGLINKQAALMVTYPSVVLPFATWLMMGYYRSIPRELEEAAMIDGCNRFGAFWRIVLPLTRPALLAVALFSITQAWNELLYAFTFLRSSEVFTLQVGLTQLIIGDVQPWGILMAAALLTGIPVVIIYMIGQKYMVAGLTAGSVKG